MKTKNKSWKTNAIALFGALCMVALLAFMYLGKITATDLFTGLGALGAFLSVLIGFFAKDSDKTGLPQ